MSGDLPTQGNRSSSLDGVLELVRKRTPARILTGRAGVSYRTATLLGLRQDHAEARDAVWAEVDFERDLGQALIAEHDLFEVATAAGSKEEYLMRPDLGRQLPDEARATIQGCCPRGVDFQVILGDGLSAFALAAQTPGLLPLLQEGARQRGWRVGRPFFVRHCRVGVMNAVGEILRPRVLTLLIGERPGLAAADSLSAYMAYQPMPGDTDARRNLVSNIHGRGLSLAEASRRIIALAGQMVECQTSGPAVKEVLDAVQLVPGKSSQEDQTRRVLPESSQGQ